MPKKRPIRAPSRIVSAALAAILLGSILSLSACGGDPSAQQQANKNQTQLDSLLKQAQTIGVSQQLLQPITTQDQQLKQAHAPLTLFSTQPLATYYQNLAQRYQLLTIQLRGVIATETEQNQQQADNAVQVLQTTLAQARTKNLPTQVLSPQLAQDQTALKSAQYPKDFKAITARASSTTLTLNLLTETTARLGVFKQTLNQMQGEHLDTSWLQAQYQDDQQQLTQATTPQAMQKLDGLVNTQYMQAVVHSAQAMPYITEAKIQDFSTKIQQLKSYGGNTAPYQKRLNADQARLQQHLSLSDYAALAQQVDKDEAALSFDLLRGQANFLVQQFHHEVTSWGNAHLYHDSFDGNSYTLDSGYADPGIGSDLDGYLASAVSQQDYQQVVNLANNDLFHMHMFEADYADKTPYSQVHNTDTQLLHYYNLTHGQIIVISLANQAMRIYQDGQLVRAFLVTTGRPELPSLPGVWPVLDRQSPTVFKSSEPKSSPYWYPDTPIHYAILYHAGGYFIHDAWWRVDYGPGTQFPHNDSGGDQSFAGNGSHGCVNMQEDQAAWVYTHTNWQTQILIY